MQVVLVMFRGEGERRSFSIVRDVTVIGRREDCDFRIPLGEISRKHCRLIKEGDALRAEDLGSSNGTYVNGSRIQESELSPGDTLKVGSVVFVVQINGVPSEADLHPAEPTASDTASGAQSEGDELLTPASQVNLEHEIGAEDHESGMSADAADEPTMDDQPADDQPAEHAAASEDTSEQYDPMSELAVDPDASSIGSMLDSDRIAEDLIIELESHDQGQPKQ